ncbi:MAG: hypothetical protein JW943_07430 [Deltaproteobacteria bacterium]|nr:hypothetical protein [Deltaproteobacteria bacterium]
MWRIDFAWPDRKLAVEVEGGAWISGRHTRPTGFFKDIEKYNELTMMGYYLLRFTPDQIDSLYAVTKVRDWFNERGLGS